jgi:hypothetical protein
MEHWAKQILLIVFLTGCATSSAPVSDGYFFTANADIMLQLEVNDLQKPLKKAIKMAFASDTQRLARHILGASRRLAVYSHNQQWQMRLQGRYPASWIHRSLRRDEGWQSLTDEAFAQDEGSWQLLVARSGRQLYVSSDDVIQLASTPAPPITTVTAPVVAQAFAAHQGLVFYVREPLALMTALNLPLSTGAILITVVPDGKHYQAQVRFLASSVLQLRLISVVIRSSRGLLIERFPSHQAMLNDSELELDDYGLVWRMRPSETELSALLAVLLGSLGQS